ncbi:NAD(P)H-quinone oxidoreductase chain 4 [Streptomyces antimycoticus]
MFGLYGGAHRRDPADEGGLSHFPWPTATAAAPALGAVVTAAVPAAQRAAASGWRWASPCSTLALAAVWLSSTSGARFQLTESHAWIKDFGVRYELGVDGIAVALIALTAVLIPFIILAGWHGTLIRWKAPGPTAAGGRPRASSR